MCSTTMAWGTVLMKTRGLVLGGPKLLVRFPVRQQRWSKLVVCAFRGCVTTADNLEPHGASNRWERRDDRVDEDNGWNPRVRGREKRSTYLLSRTEED